MRELPEPDINTASHIHQRIIAYSSRSVLAIQKQAYEDGLRDAATVCNALSHGLHDPLDDARSKALSEAARRISSLLTASQKEAKQKRHACDDPLCAVCGNPT